MNRAAALGLLVLCTSAVASQSAPPGDGVVIAKGVFDGFGGFEGRVSMAESRGAPGSELVALASPALDVAPGTQVFQASSRVSVGPEAAMAGETLPPPRPGWPVEILTGLAVTFFLATRRLR